MASWKSSRPPWKETRIVRWHHDKKKKSRKEKDSEALCNLGGFPFRRFFAVPAEVQYNFLRENDDLVEVITSDADGSKKIVPAQGIWTLCDGLSDMFNEETRIRSRPLSAPTPLERWGSLTKETLAELMSQVAEEPPDGVVNPFLWRAREALALSGPECTQFRPSIAKAFYRLCAEALDNSQCLRVLDPCGGWGDRLLGALASKVVGSLTVVDPNPLLHDSYRQIARLQPDVEVTTICAPFEIAHNVEEKYYDVVFTSPPFYDKEKYWAPGSAGQAEALRGPMETVAWRSHWIRNWYVPFLTKAAMAVRPGGVLGLYVCDTSSGGLCDVTIEIIVTKMCFEACGTLRVGRRRLLPIFCFRRPDDQ